MKNQSLIIACILLFSFTAFSQDKPKFSVEVTAEHKFRFGNHEYNNNFLGLAPALGGSMKILYNPKGGKFQYTIGGGVSTLQVKQKYDDFEKFIQLNPIANIDHLEAPDVTKIKVQYNPTYVNFSFGVRQSLVDRSWFQFYQELGVNQYVKQKDDIDINYYRRTTGGGDWFGEYTYDRHIEHASTTAFSEQYTDKASKSITELNYTLGCLFFIKNRVGIGGHVDISKSLRINDKTIFNNYWGVGTGLKLQVKF